MKQPVGVAHFNDALGDQSVSFLTGRAVDLAIFDVLLILAVHGPFQATSDRRWPSGSVRPAQSY